MHAIWIDEGADPDFPLLEARGFLPGRTPPHRLFFSAREPRLRQPTYLDAVRGRGYGCGLYWADTWDAGLAGAQAAELMNRRWLELGGGVKSLHVQFNVERHDAGYVAELLHRWRQLRPTLPTSWAMEGFQGGWIATIRAQVVTSKVLLVPEAYTGSMAPFDTAGVVKDLTDFGIPYDQVTVFHDARELRRGWDGFAFTQARLPR